MAENKRFFWLKLKEDFFEDETIEWLEEQPNGKEYVLFYLKMCLKSLKHDGKLYREVGTRIIPYDIKKLSEITKTPVDTVMIATKVLSEIGLVQRMDDETLYMNQVTLMTGNSANNSHAERQRRYRERLKQKALQAPSQNVTSHSDESIEYRDKSIDDVVADAPTKPKKVRHKHGEYQNVLLTDEDMQKLQAEFPSDWQERIERLSEYMASKGASYKNHLATIRAWARKEVKAKPQQKQDDYYADKVLGVEI